MSEFETPTGVEDTVEYSKKDFMSDQTIRWCPGCGDYSILSQTQTVLSKLGVPKEKIAVISVIGCSSRFPYYMDTYGFHTIHGRAPAFAAGAKCVNPELDVWVITGDGDGLSIGGNHFAHVLRRNLDIVYMLFNNRIYGLTKGQYSPTSEVGKVTKSTPMGSLDHPFNPLKFALGSEATFVARSVDVYAKDLRAVLVDAHNHRGTSLVEIYQNCNIFNDLTFDDVVNRKVRDERVVFVTHGEPMTFGAPDSPKGIRLNGTRPEVVDLGDQWTAEDCLVHDETDPVLAQVLVEMDYPEFPVPMGVLHRVERPTYDGVFNAQVDAAVEKQGEPSLEKLLYGGQTWTVE
jgi:2-oxoglutarate ferredoxin oxidoreductase subunit beta